MLPEAIINRPLVGTYSGEQHAQQDRPAFRIIVAEWAHNKREVVRVEITVHRGRPVVRVRKWYRNDDGVLKMRKLGVIIAIKNLPKFVASWAKALEIACALGLLDDGSVQ